VPKLEEFLIGSSETLMTALQRMTDNRRGVLFVCDEDAHLVGVLSDGDVRRSLLDNTQLVVQVSKIMNTDPVTAGTIADARNLVKRLAIVAVPVLDSDGRIREMAVEDRVNVLSLTSHSEAAQEATGLGAVAVIPARGGSKRIPRKNLALVGGCSLVGWAIQAAREAQSVARVLVSTDDVEIAAECRKLGAEVPWLRPAQLARDESPTVAAVEHALRWVVENVTPVPEFAVLLEPTAPMRQGKHIDEALDLLTTSDADCVMSVCEVPHVFHPEELLVVTDGQLCPYLPYRTMDTRHLRGSQSSVYLPNGSVYAVRIQSVLAGHSLYGKKTLPYIMPWSEFLDIDTEDDLAMANLRMQRRAMSGKE
jgi:CMP-N-acetylneuraminic acid synthetase